jgi:hypothetical protein
MAGVCGLIARARILPPSGPLLVQTLNPADTVFGQLRLIKRASRLTSRHFAIAVVRLIVNLLFESETFHLRIGITITEIPGLKSFATNFTLKTCWLWLNLL